MLYFIFGLGFETESKYKNNIVLQINIQWVTCKRIRLDRINFGIKKNKTFNTTSRSQFRNTDIKSTKVICENELHVKQSD